MIEATIVILGFFVFFAAFSSRVGSKEFKDLQLPDISSLRLQVPVIKSLETKKMKEIREPISIPRHLRRAQQALNRKNRLISENLREMYHKQQAMDISGQLIELNEKHNEINDEKINIKQNMLDLNEQNITMRLKNTSDEYKNEITKKLLLLMKERQDLDFHGQKMELDKIDFNLYRREIMHQLEHKALDNKKGELRNIEGAIGNKITELRHAENRFKLAYERSMVNLKSILNEINLQHRHLLLTRKENSLFYREQSLKLYNQKLNNLKVYIDQMFMLKSQWLSVQRKENNISNREEELRIDEKYDQTMLQISKLYHVRKENDLINREKELKLRNILSNIEKKWSLW